MDADTGWRPLPHPLAGLTVVELAEDPAGEFAGQAAGDMGADVIKVEPPEGAPTPAHRALRAGAATATRTPA